MANASFGGYCAATVSVHGDFLTSCIHIAQQYTGREGSLSIPRAAGRLCRKNAFVCSSGRQEGFDDGEKETVPVLGKIRYSVYKNMDVQNIGNRTPAPGRIYAACRRENTSRSPALLPVSFCAADGNRPAAGGGAHCAPGGTPAERMPRKVPAVPPERAPRDTVYEPDLRFLRSDNIKSGAISFARQGWYT